MHLFVMNPKFLIEVQLGVLLFAVLTLNAPIATKIICFSCLLKCLRNLYGKQCGPRSDCSYRSSLFWSTLFASIFNSSVMLGNYLQQTTSADDILSCIFFLGALRVNQIAVTPIFLTEERKSNLSFRTFHI